MADSLSIKRRSEIMSSIRSVNTEPELIVRRYLHRNGVRFRLHDNSLPGKPDLKLSKYKTVIFVHGCFWHGHPCKRIPKTNTRFWSEKILKNQERDKKNKKLLRKHGWRTIEVWQCNLRSEIRRAPYLRKLLHELSKSK